jgi:hypothetical protein
MESQHQFVKTLQYTYLTEIRKRKEEHAKRRLK